MSRRAPRRALGVDLVSCETFGSLIDRSSSQPLVACMRSSFSVLCYGTKSITNDRLIYSTRKDLGLRVQGGAPSNLKVHEDEGQTDGCMVDSVRFCTFKVETIRSKASPPNKVSLRRRKTPGTEQKTHICVQDSTALPRTQPGGLPATFPCAGLGLGLVNKCWLRTAKIVVWQQWAHLQIGRKTWMNILFELTIIEEEESHKALPVNCRVNNGDDAQTDCKAFFREYSKWESPGPLRKP